MSDDDQLYAVARKRVQQRNRRWMLWSVDLGVLILLLANLILMGSTFAVALFLAWAGVFTVHTIIAGFAESTQSSIDNEVAKLRAGLQYEKPKRLELGADGELVDASDEQPKRRVEHD